MDFQLWEDALLSLTTVGRKLIHSVEDYVREPHRDLPWYALTDESLLYFEFEQDSHLYHRVYHRDADIRKPNSP